MRRFNSILLGSTALAATFAISSPAAAQDQPLPPNPGATAQQNPAEPAQNADAPQNPASISGNDAGNSIVVTGLRRSLQSARNIKRNSDQIVDAVVAEDIGKLPDITVSDTAARIPGIEVERAGGEANRVLLRGLDNTYYTTTYNGREIFTAETRSVALQDFPAGAIASVEAFKTSTANLVEPGIAGLLNVRSRRPFDFEAGEISGSIWALHPNQSRDTSLNGNLLLSDRWETGNGAEFGAMINFSYTRLHYKDSVRRHGFFIADLDGYRSPDWPEIHYNEGDRWRPSINGALQFRHGNLELYAEGLWQGYRERVYDRMWAQPLWNCGGQATYSNIQLRPGTNDILSGTVQDPGCPGSAWGFKGATHRETNTYQFAAGGSYDAGPLRITADIARTYSHFQLRTESVDEQIASNQYTVNWYTGYPGGPGPTFQISGIDPTNPAIYQYRGFFEDHQDPKGKDWQGRVDFDFDPHVSAIPKIQWGVRYTDRDASDTAGSLYWNAGRLGIPITQVPYLSYQLSGAAFRGDNMPPFPIDWLTPTYGSIWRNLVAFRQWNIGLLGYGSDNGPPVDPGRSFNINEKTLAGYGQLNFRLGEGDTYADGIVGLRVVRTRDSIQGAQSVANPTGPATITPVNYNHSYTDWLPNLNVNIHMGRPWVLRFAATKTITRPTYQELNPGLSLGIPPNCTGLVSGCFQTGSGGNPFLSPLRSNNYDASLEYYFSGTGYASIGAFRRDMKGFILNRTYQFPNQPSGVPLEVTGPVNSQKAKLQGFEAQVRTFFDWSFVPGFLRSFGIDANVSYIDAKALQDVIDLGPNPQGFDQTVQRNLTIPDVSRWTWNLTGMYERGPLSLRLSYNLRSRYPEGALSLRQDGTGYYTLQGHAKQSPRLDLSASYNVNDNVTLFFDWTNILKHPFQSDIVRVNYGHSQTGVPVSTEVFPMVIRYEETILSGGVRFNFAGHKRPAPAPVMAPPPPPPPPVPAPPPPQPAPPPPPPPAPERGS